MITFEERVLNAAYQLNETEEAIVDYIKQNKQEVSQESISKLAAATFVAPNAISRLGKKLRYDGFVAMKLGLREDLQRQEDSQAGSQQDILNRNFDLIDEQREDQVIDHLHHAKMVRFFAVGETAYVAHNFAYIFNTLDQKTQFVTYENQITFEINNNPGVLVFIISQSGKTPQVLRIADAVKEADQTLISLTGLHQNPLAEAADTALYSYAPLRMWRGFNFTDKTPLYIIMNALFERYFTSVV